MNIWMRRSVLGGAARRPRAGGLRDTTEVRGRGRGARSPRGRDSPRRAARVRSARRPGPRAGGAACRMRIGRVPAGGRQGPGFRLICSASWQSPWCGRIASPKASCTPSARTRSTTPTCPRGSSWASCTACGAHRRRPKSLLLADSGEPLDDDTGFLLYEIYMEQRRGEDALRIARVARRAESGFGAGPPGAGQRLRPAWSGRPTPSAYCARPSQSDPNNLTIYAALARSRRERGDHAGEVAVYREILDRNPGHHAALVALSDVQMNADDREGAMMSLEEIEEHHPGDLRSSRAIGLPLLRGAAVPRGRGRVSSAWWRRTSDEYEVVFFLGMAQAAIREIRRGPSRCSSPFRRTASSTAKARTQIAALYERSEQYERGAGGGREGRGGEAVAGARAVRRDAALQGRGFRRCRHPSRGPADGRSQTDDELLYNLGVVYGEADRVDESIAYMRRALEQNPDNASALNYIGYTWASAASTSTRPSR